MLRKLFLSLVVIAAIPALLGIAAFFVTIGAGIVAGGDALLNHSPLLERINYISGGIALMSMPVVLIAGIGLAIISVRSDAV